jgi:hypothetical protein
MQAVKSPGYTAMVGNGIRSHPGQVHLLQALLHGVEEELLLLTAQGTHQASHKLSKASSSTAHPSSSKLRVVLTGVLSCQRPCRLQRPTETLSFGCGW